MFGIRTITFTFFNPVAVECRYSVLSRGGNTLYWPKIDKDSGGSVRVRHFSGTLDTVSCSLNTNISSGIIL